MTHQFTRGNKRQRIETEKHNLFVRSPTGRAFVLENIDVYRVNVAKLKHTLGNILGYSCHAIQMLCLAYRGKCLDDPEVSLANILAQHCGKNINNGDVCDSSFIMYFDGSEQLNEPRDTHRKTETRNGLQQDWHGTSSSELNRTCSTIKVSHLLEEDSHADKTKREQTQRGRCVLHMHRSPGSASHPDTLIVRSQSDEDDPEFWRRLVTLVDADVVHFSPYQNMLEIPRASQTCADQVAGFARYEGFHVLRFDSSSTPMSPHQQSLRQQDRFLQASFAATSSHQDLNFDMLNHRDVQQQNGFDLLQQEDGSNGQSCLSPDMFFWRIPLDQKPDYRINSSKSLTAYLSHEHSPGNSISSRTVEHPVREPLQDTPNVRPRRRCRRLSASSMARASSARCHKFNEAGDCQHQQVQNVAFKFSSIHAQLINSKQDNSETLQNHQVGEAKANTCFQDLQHADTVDENAKSTGRQQRSTSSLDPLLVAANPKEPAAIAIAPAEQIIFCLAIAVVLALLFVVALFRTSAATFAMKSSNAAFDSQT